MPTFPRVLVLASLLALQGCNCGTAANVGESCTQNSDCQSGVCGVDLRCAASSDGGQLSDGGLLPDGGNPNNTDAGEPCVNLECLVPTCSGGATTRITGTVFDPAGQTPLYNATVFVPNKPLDAFTQGVSCDSCGALISGAPVAIAISGPDGTFVLDNVPAGSSIPLVIQVGKWRRQVTLANVAACQNNVLADPNLTRLPRNQSEGDLPKIAIASGDADAFECLLRKIGISDSEFTPRTGTGRVHFYVENGLDFTSASSGTSLWNSTANLSKYDVVILPCEGAPNYKSASYVDNLVAYTNLGGRVFTTHYGYIWTAEGWPQAAQWDPGLDDLYNSVFNVTVDQSFPKGQAFAQWLQNVGATTTLGTLGLIETRHDVVSVNPGSTRWLYGSIPGSNPSGSVQHLTYNTPFSATGDAGTGPQCGRVVYSDFHVTAGATNGQTDFPGACVSGALSAQEKALEFMFFDLSACVQDDGTAPTACKAAGQSCSAAADCCTGLTCLDATASPCAGSGCTCQSGIN